MSAAIKKRYQVEIFLKSEQDGKVVLIPIKSNYTTMEKALKEIKRAEASPASYAKAVLTIFDIYKGIWVENNNPKVYVIDADFMKNYF
jgi:hypothetical protein